MPVFMDDIATIGSLEVKRGIRNSTRKENKIYDSKNRKRKRGSNNKRGQRWSYTKGELLSKIKII